MASSANDQNDKVLRRRNTFSGQPDIAEDDPTQKGKNKKKKKKPKKKKNEHAEETGEDKDENLVDNYALALEKKADEDDGEEAEAEIENPDVQKKAEVSAVKKPEAKVRVVDDVSDDDRTSSSTSQGTKVVVADDEDDLEEELLMATLDSNESEETGDDKQKKKKKGRKGPPKNPNFWINKKKTKKQNSSQSSKLLSSLMGYFNSRKNAIPQLHRVFHTPPESHPTTVCFETKDIHTHKVLKAAVDKATSHIPDTKVITMTYIAQCVIFKSLALANRWVITLNNEEAKTSLLKTGIVLDKGRSYLRSYDDVMADEYKQFLSVRRILTFVQGSNNGKNDTKSGGPRGRPTRSAKPNLSSTCRF